MAITRWDSVTRKFVNEDFAAEPRMVIETDGFRFEAKHAGGVPMPMSITVELTKEQSAAIDKFVGGLIRHRVALGAWAMVDALKAEAGEPPAAFSDYLTSDTLPQRDAP